MTVLSLIVFKHGKQKVSNKIFNFFIISVLAWIFTNLIANLSCTNKNIDLLLWSKLTLVGPTILPLLLILFANSFPENKLTLNKIYILILSVITVGILFFIPTSLNVKAVQVIDYRTCEFSFIPGQLYIFFVLYFLFGIFASAYLLIKKYLQASKIERLQIKYILVGLVSSILFGVFVNAILPMLGYSRLINIGPASSMFFIGFTTYAIIETHLFDIHVIAAEVLVVLIGLGLLIDTLLSKTFLEEGLKGVLFILASYGGYRLVLSVKEEIRRRQEIQKLTIQLKHANARLQELDRLKSEFLSVASHELNSPMSIIKGYLHMILWEGFGKVDKEARTYLEKVYMKTDQLAKLVADLLNVSRIEQGKIKLDIKPIDIHPVLKNICGDHAIKAKEKGLTLTYYAPKRPLPKVLSDIDKLSEVLQNLLSNAIKFTKTGGVELSVEQKDGYIQVNVKDTGIGIPKSVQGDIFGKFYRVDNSWVREVGGTGLGLYISREYVRLMNGEIWFDSQGKDKGTTFHFTLPIAKPGDFHQEAQELTKKEERPEYTKSPQDEIKESLERIKNHNNHEQEERSL